MRARASNRARGSNFGAVRCAKFRSVKTKNGVTRRINIVILPVYWSYMHIHTAQIHAMREITLTSLIAYFAEPKRQPILILNLCYRTDIFFSWIRGWDLSSVRFNCKKEKKEIIICRPISVAKLRSFSLSLSSSPSLFSISVRQLRLFKLRFVRDVLLKQ